MSSGVLESVLSKHREDLLRIKRDLEELEGKYPFLSLFDLDGCQIAALRIRTRHGDAWGVLETDSPESKVVRTIQESQSVRGELARRKDSAKGFYVGYVLAPATVQIRYRYPLVVRTDGGFNRRAVVLDNGKGETQGTWYQVIEEYHVND